MAKDDIFLMEKNLEQCGFHTSVDSTNNVIYCSHEFFNGDNMNIEDGERLIAMIIDKPKYSYDGIDDDGFYVIKHHPFLNGFF